MIVGVDISEFQGQVNWDVVKNNVNFVIIRSSFGVGYFDKWFGNNRTQVRQANIPHGFYHYCYPQYNTPEDEADWFLTAVGPLQDGESLYLDFEEQYSGDVVGWCKAWLDRVQSKTRCKPLIYLNQSLTKGYNWTPVVDSGYGLWIAAYTYDPNNNNAEIGNWSFAAMQQWTSEEQVPGLTGKVDGDVFFGTQAQFKAYGYKTPQPIQQSPAQIPTAPVVQPAPVVEVTPTQETPQQPVENVSTHTVEVPITYPKSDTPPLQTNPTPLPTPQKPKLDIRSRIVFVFLNIFITLKKYVRKNN